MEANQSSSLCAFRHRRYAQAKYGCIVDTLAAEVSVSMDEKATPASHGFAFGPFVLLPSRQVLLREGVQARIGNRSLEILNALVERPGELVTKRELFERVWPHTVVEEGNLKVNMAALRRVLGDGPRTIQYIATVIGRGYRFVAPVQHVGPEGSVSSIAASLPRRDNLPHQTTRVIGRGEVIRAITQELAASRLVSIVGAGGVGKTTVALAVAEQRIGDFKDGVWLIDLAPLREASLVPNAIAAAVGLATHAADMLAALTNFLKDREVLLVLDNCEPFIDAAAFCADRLLAGTAGTRILATGREPLRLKGERVRRLAGLDTPPALAEIALADAVTFPAVELFIERAEDRIEALDLSEADVRRVAEICRKLDGLPLAIELAATRVDTFGVEDLLRRLDDHIRVLSGHRGAPERHRTLFAMIRWSYDLLSVSESALLRGLSVFASTFGLDAALAVGSNSAELLRSIDDLASLVAKSLLSVETGEEAVTYRLLETTRAYCLERLRSSGEEEITRRRHAEHIHAVLQQAPREWELSPSRE